MSLRVLHVNNQRTWRGGERQVELLVGYSSDRIHSAIACDPTGTLYQRLSKNHEVVDLSIRHGLDLKAAFRLKKFARKYDLIHCHTPKAQSVAILAKILGGKTPVVCTKRTSFPIGNNYFSKLKYRRTDRIVCVSRASAEVLQKQLPDLTLKVIHSAIEKAQKIKPVDLEALIPETRNRKIIGYVAAFTEEKNPQVFLKTATSVIDQNDDCCFLWIGDGPLKTNIQAQVEKLGLSDRIFLPGFQKDIQSWIAALDVLFFPSSSEGFPTTVLQALQVSVPVVASSLPGIREMITQGETGLLEEANHPDGFANKILEILSNDDLSRFMRDNGLQSVKQYYADQMAEKYIRLYQEMLGSTNSQ